MGGGHRLRGRSSEAGSILLPVIVVLLLVASAATAMTVQTRASLREASTRRDRVALGFLADALVRAASLALTQAASSRSAPPFPLDGTPQGCALNDGRRFLLSVQDEGGLVDLNKGSPELLLRVLTGAGVSGWDAKTMVQAITARRDPKPVPTMRRGTSTRSAPSPERVREGFQSADEIDGLPGMTNALYERLRPIFSVANGSPGLDPQVAGVAVKAIIPSKELTAATFEPMTTPSSHAAFSITVTVVLRAGMRFQRQAAFNLDPNAGPLGRFSEWNAPVSLGPLPAVETGAFCARSVSALMAL